MPKKSKEFVIKSVKGFTLIELLVVIGIVAVLVIIVVSAVNPVQRIKEARDTKRKTDIHQIRLLLETYNTLFGTYPHMNGGDVHAATLQASINSNWNYSTQLAYVPYWIKDIDPLIGHLPSDPINEDNGFNTPQSFIYKYKTDDYSGCPGIGKWYALWVSLENTNDPAAIGNKPIKWCDGTLLDGTDPNYNIFPNTYLIVSNRN